MNFVSWNTSGVNFYFGDGVKFLTYDELMLYMAVIGIAVGLMVGVIVSYIDRVNSYRAVKALVKEGCNTPDTAKTIDQLNVKNKGQIKALLRDGKLLRKVVFCTDAVDGKKTNVNTAAFYIPEEMRIPAEVRYSREGMSPPALVITLIVITAAAVGALYIIPELVTMAGNVFGNN